MLYKKTDLGMSYKKLKTGESLAEKNSEIAAEWNVEKNGRLTPWDITSRNTRKVWCTSIINISSSYR